MPSGLKVTLWAKVRRQKNVPTVVGRVVSNLPVFLGKEEKQEMMETGLNMEYEHPNDTIFVRFKYIDVNATTKCCLQPDDLVCLIHSHSTTDLTNAHLHLDQALQSDWSRPCSVNRTNFS